MNHKLRTKSGLTLIEMTLVIATAALLITIGLPAVRAIFRSFESESSARSMISSALASARAIAAKNQRYAGIRFQKAYHPKGPLEASQYMVFVVHEEPTRMGGLTVGFRAVEGLEPIKLPDTIEVMDLRYGPDLLAPVGDGIIDADADISNPDVLRDTTSFSIIFSPSGKLVIHDVRVRNRHGVYCPASPTESADDIFNCLENIVDHNTGAFIQDDYPELGLYREESRNSFVIYETEKFRQTYKKGTAWSEYLVRLAPQATYINPYTGTIISSKQ